MKKSESKSGLLGSQMGWRIGYLISAVALYLADQTTKAWAVRRLRFGEEKTIIDGLLDFVYTENRGIAFGQLQEGGAFGRWLLVTLASAALIAVLFYFFRVPRNDDRLLGACALLLAGIAGNLTDRARFGYVIDFISVHAGSYHWPTFNIADASICIGAALIALDVVLSGRRKPTALSSQAAEVSSQTH